MATVETGQLGTQAERVAGTARLRLGVAVPHGPTVMALAALVTLLALVGIGVAAVTGAFSVWSAVLIGGAVWVGVPTLTVLALAALAVLSRR
jgi:ABC-type microcin C transport system permease subunit YejE